MSTVPGISDLQEAIANFKSKGPELLVDLADHCARAVADIGGIDKDRAEQIGYNIARRMMSHWAGQILYFPKGAVYLVSERHRIIFAEFNGYNHAELARKYDLSVQQVYHIIKAVRRDETARRQGNLFSESV